MRRLFIVVSLSMVILGVAAWTGAQCLDRIGDWGFGPTEAADGNGTIAVFGSGRVLRIARVSDPANPVVEASLEMPGQVERVQVVGTWAYVSASEGGFVVVDISSPNHPEIAATFETEDRIRGIAVVGDLAFVGDGYKGLVTLDVSDPSAPVQLSALALDGNAEDIAVHGSHAFLAEAYTGLRVVDVSDPSNPVSVAVIDELDHSRRVEVTDDGMTAYLTNYFEGFHVIDVSDHLAPAIVGFVEIPDYTIDLETDGDYLYAANRGYGMRVFNIGDPRAPVEVRRVDHDGENHSVRIHGDLAYLGNYTAGLRLVDISSPPEAEELGFIDGTPESKGVAVQGGLVYVAGGNQQVLVDLSRPDQPAEISTTDFTGYVKRAAVDGRYVYAAGDYRGVRVIDIDDPSQPEEVGFVQTSDAYDVVKNGDLLYVSCYDDGITVVDVSVPTDPMIVGIIEDFHAGFLNHSGGVIYAPDYNVGVHLVDVTDPTTPADIGLMEVTKPIGRPEINGQLLFIADANDGVHIFDNTDPRAPVELSRISQVRFGFGMAAIGDLLFVATIYDGAYVFDVSDPTAPMELESGPLATVAEGEVSSEGNLVLVAEKEGGIEVFDLGACFSEPPTADFAWRPGNPEAGRAVQLTDTSIGSVETRQWNFGDGSSSAQRNPNHVWAEAGAYEVRLTVNGPNGSQTATKTVTVDPRTGGVPPITDPGEYSNVIAAASHVQGSGEHQLVTDVVLHNPGTSAVEGYIWFMKGGQNNLGAEGQLVAVSPGASLLIEDIVLSLFGEDDASGALLIGSDQPLLVTSRTYNDASSGTYGQFIPGRDIESAVGRNEEVRLIQLTRSPVFRTNLGVANPSGNGITVDVSLRDAGGTEFATRTLTVPPYGFLQKTDILGADVADAVAVVSSSTQDAAFFPYASVVDNRTGDPMMVEPIQPGNEIVIAAAAHVGGLEDTDWRTDLEICNFAGESTQFDLNLLMTDHNNSSPQSVAMTLAGTTCERVSDVLDASFSYEGSAALEIQSSKHELTVSSRTYNTTDTGTYGQFLPGATAVVSVAAGEEARIIQLAQSTGSSTGFRTNIGFVNRAGSPTIVALDLRTETGTSLGTLDFTLEPYEHRQINRVFRQVTSGQVSNGFAIVTTSSAGGSFIAYASVVDNASGDPVFMPGMVVGD